MGKQGKKGKRSSKNELDAILAQLKKTYIDDIDNELDDTINSKEDDEDSELNQLIEKLFASDTSNVTSENEDDKTDEPESKDVTESDDAKNADDQAENVDFDKSVIEKPFVEEPVGKELVGEELIGEELIGEESKVDQTIEQSNGEASLLDKITEDNNAEQDVEDILQLMFASNSSEGNIDSDEHDPESDLVADSTENCIYDEETHLENEDETITSLDDEDVFDEYDEEDDETEAFDNFEDLEFDEIEAAGDVDFAVEDEEYESNLEEPLPSHEDIAPINEVKSEESQSLHMPVQEEYQPTIILDPKEYTFDPLQQTLPSLTSTRTQSDTFAKSKISSSNISTNRTSEESDSSAFDNNDISLLLKFGYEEEVRAKVGEERAQEILIDKDKEFTPEPHKIPYGYCGKELTDRSQLAQINKKYKTDRRTLILTTIIIAIISAATILLDLFFDFSPNRSGFIFVLLAEILLVSLMALLLRKKLTSGVIDIIRFEPTPYSILAFLMLAFLLCNLANALLYLINVKTISDPDLMLFGGCMAFYTISILVSDLINCQREINTFEIIASAETLFTTEKYKNPSEISSHERRNENQHASSHFTDSKTYKIRKTSLISGYFRKMSHGNTKNVNIIYILGIVPILSLIIGCVCAIISGNIMRGISSMMITTFLCTPFSYILLPTVTEYIASLILKKKNSTFVGEEAISDLARTDSLFFKDTDAIEVLSYTEIHPSKSVDEQETLDIAYRVFGALGGPLGEFAKKSGNISAEKSDAEVVINSISDNGIELYFDSSINILIGDRQFMSSNNIRVKIDSNLNTAIKGFDRSVIYMAFDGVPKLGFIVTSKIKADFANTVSMLDSNGIKVFVDTYEPQINDLYFEQNKTSISTAISVCKSDEYESATQRYLCDGNIVCTSSSLDVAETIAFGKKIIDQRKKHRRLHAILVLAGFILSCLLTLLLNVDQAISVISGLKIHITLLLSLIMILLLIPAIISAYKLYKYKFEGKKKESDDTAKR